MIRILHVIGVMNRGGAETMIMNLYRNIDRSKVQFDFVQNEGEEAAFDQEICGLGGKIYHCPRYRGKNHFAYTKWWNAFFKNHKDEYPVVHGHIGSTAAIYLSIAKRYGAFTIAHSHGAGGSSILYRLYAYPTRFIADQFFACSEKACISRYGKRVFLSDNSHILNNSIEVSRFIYNEKIRNELRESLHISEQTKVIGHVGRFVKIKNHIFLLDVFENIHKQDSNTKLLLVGDGEMRNEIESVIKDKNLENAVIITGVQSDVWKYYQIMDAFVFPSFHEGLGIVVIEAQTAGLPCFVTDSIPQEVAVTDLVEFCSLSKGAGYWTDRILSSKEQERKNESLAIIKAGYDIAETSKWLQNFYLKVAEYGE